MNTSGVLHRVRPLPEYQLQQRASSGPFAFAKTSVSIILTSAYFFSFLFLIFASLFPFFVFIFSHLLSFFLICAYIFSLFFLFVYFPSFFFTSISFPHSILSLFLNSVTFLPLFLLPPAVLAKSKNKNRWKKEGGEKG